MDQDERAEDMIQALKMYKISFDIGRRQQFPSFNTYDGITYDGGEHNQYNLCLNNGIPKKYCETSEKREGHTYLM